MKKNLFFCDIFDTIINERIRPTEKDFQEVGNFFNDYLDENSFIILVTNGGSHSMTFEELEYVLRGITKYVDKKKQKNILFYETFASHDIAEYGNSVEFCDNPEIQFQFRDFYEKIKVFDEVMKQFKKDEIAHIYGAGNDEKDVDLLLQISEYGGKSFLINDYLKLANSLSIEDLVLKISRLQNQRSYIKTNNLDEDQAIMIENFYSWNRYFKLLALYENGIIDKKRLIELFSFLSITRDTKDAYEWGYNRDGTKLDFAKTYTQIQKRLILVDNRSQLFDFIKKNN